MSDQARVSPNTALKVLALLALAPIAAAAALFVVAYSRAPQTTDLTARTFALERAHRASALPLSRIAPTLRNAVVATEDERFYEHRGVDLIALLRAVPFDVTHLSFAQGASTITEQLAKLIYLDGNDHSAIRKTEDVVLGYRLGHHYPHEAILNAYLNIVYLGSGQYGVESASRHYFGRNAAQLNLSQASLLAGLIQAPSSYDPQTNPQGARTRQIEVLRSMVRNGFATEDEAAAAVGSTLQLKSGTALPAISGISFAPGAPFDSTGLVAAMLMLILAITALVLARVLRPTLHAKGFLRAAFVGLMIVSAFTAAHSIQVI